MAATQLENVTMEEAAKALIIAIDDCKKNSTDL